MDLKTRAAVGAMAGLIGSTVLGCDILKQFTEPSRGLSIRKFTASPAEILPGASTTLSWEVEGADSVQIDNGIGAMKAKGSVQVKLDWTTLFTLSARAETSAATATVRVLVKTTSTPPTPGPAPTPSPTPSPSPTPTPSPSPSPTPGAGACGASTGPAGNCAVALTKPTALPVGECIELNRVAVDNACPVGFNSARQIRFDVTAQTARKNLRWRRAASSSDIIDPAGGEVVRRGSTTVTVSDVALSNSVTFEIVDDGDAVLLSFTLRHY